MTENEKIRPQLLLFSPANLTRLYEAAIELLSRFGVWFEDADTHQILLEAGATSAANDRTRLLLPLNLIEKSLKTTPSQVLLYSATGDSVLNLSGDHSHYAPGSAALNLFDWNNQKERLVVANDLLNLIKITNRLDIFDVQATSLIPADVPQALSDCYRLYLSLLFSDKPIISGLFQLSSFEVVFDLLKAVRGNASALRERPLAILDCCPISPLRWCELSCQTIKRCAENYIPVELVPMLLPGATAPIDLYSAFVQYLAEILAGIVLVQVVQPGAPVIAGNAPAVFDMRTITPAVGRSETMLYLTGCAQMSKWLNLPTHTYACVSDTKTIDIETGFESSIGAFTAATTGINLIAGAGMLATLNSFSFEKLLFDHEILRMANRFKTGIQPHPDGLIEQFFEMNANDNTFLTVDKTIKLFRQEYIYPASPMGRHQDFSAVKLKNLELAHQQVQDILKRELNLAIDTAKAKLLSGIMIQAGKSIGAGDFPFLWQE